MEKLSSVPSVSAIVTVLQPPHAQQVAELWRAFARSCQTQFVLTQKPVPHFTWQTAESYDEAALDSVLYKIARQSEPFSVKTSGIGLFTGSMIVVYIAIVKSDSLIRLQERIWEQAQPFSKQINRYYHPDLWIPHITLAYDPLDDQALGCVIEKVALRRFEWELPVRQLAIIHAGQGAEFRTRKRYPIGSKTGAV